VSVRGHGTVELEDDGIAAGSAPDVPEWFHSRLVNTVGDVANNPWEHARIEKIEAKLDVHYARDVWRLRGVELLDPVVDAGEKARVRLHLVPNEGVERTRVVEVAMPQELAGKDVEIEVAPGYDVAPELAAPDSLDELLANEPKQTPPKSVVLSFRVPSHGVAYRGHVTPRLPGFNLDVLRPTSSDAGPEMFQSWSRTVVSTDVFIEGRDKVKVKVRPVVR
jgi:hypothetical protein